MLGCGGQGGGIAPSVPLAPHPPGSGSNSEGILKYGQTLTTTSGWSVTVDNADPVEIVELANGWTVEVLSE